MIKETKHCLSHLTDFSGRDARQTFWFYVLALVILQFAVGIVISVPMMVSMFSTAFEAAQAGADPEAMQAEMMAGVGTAMGGMVWLSALTYLVTALLFVAAFVRRLHDSGKPGWWAAIPLVTQAVAVWFSFRQMEEMERVFTSALDPVQMQQMQAELAADPTNYVSYLGYLVVIVFGVMKSDEGENRYGPEPQRF